MELGHPLVLPILKMVCIFAVMLLGVRLKWGLALSMLLGSVAMGLLFGVAPGLWCRLALDIFTDRSVLVVWGVIILVLSLTTLMERTGQAERFMEAFSYKITSPILRMVFFPVLIGLLPVPGGAVFSAPMISAVARDLGLPEEDKSLINYWFRHSCEMVWPLFPAVILAASLAGAPTPRLLVETAPMCLVFLGVGWFFLVRPLSVPKLPRVSGGGDWRVVLREGAPLVVALGGALVLMFSIALLMPGSTLDAGVLLALAAAVWVCLRQNKLGMADMCRTLRQPQMRSMILFIAAIGVFKNVLSGGGVIENLLVAGTGMTALWLTATVVSFMVGALTGLMMASVGSVFPLLIGLAQGVDPANVLQWTALGMFSAMAGFMLSPLHICFVLSCEYFRVRMASCWRRLPAPALSYFAICVLYFLLIRKG